MLMGPSKTPPHDLNILVTAQHFKVLKCFFRHALGYEWNEHTTTAHTVMFESVEHFVRYDLHGMSMTVSVVRDAGMFKTVVSAPCTADMTIMTPGSVCTFYPSLTLNEIAVVTPNGLLINANSPLGCSANGQFKVHDNTQFSGTVCGASCPAIWRCVGDIKNSLVVDWDRRYSLKYSIQKSHTIWRLSESCDNKACKFRTIQGLYHLLMAPVKIPADNNAILDVICQMRVH